MTTANASVSTGQLIDWVRDARQRTFDLVADLSDEQLLGPQLEIVNPLLWEIGHTAWFQEKWVLRHALGEPPLRPEADALWDSMAIAHDTRWDLALPSRDEALRYLREVRDRVVDALQSGRLTEDGQYFVKLALFHEDMHTEAFTYTRQTHGWPAPKFSEDVPLHSDTSQAPGTGTEPYSGGDVEFPGGTFLLGATRDEPFVFDNEKWAFPVELRPFAIARTAVTQGEFRDFVDDGGYARRELWTDRGWKWRETESAGQPVYWRKDGVTWLRRVFDQWVELEPELPMLHVNWHEAQAWCRWAGRRLPSEAEWEAAAAAEIQDAAGPAEFSPAGGKRRFPWGDEPPTPDRANFDWQAGGTVPVTAHPTGDTPRGCRQMLGNVWEWTDSDFLPFPGFRPDPYKDYSAPWFGTRKVLRGGCWATRLRMLRNTWRNYYEPHRRDVWAGFRTCAP